MPTIKNQHDPYSSYNFWVEWDGIVHAGFQECSGISLTRAAGDYREGTDKGLGMRKVPGLNSKENITLKRGMAENNELWEWHNKLFNKKEVLRRTVTIVLTDDLGNKVRGWTLGNCWPTTWSGSDFNATADEFAIETLELVYESITLES